MFHRQVPLPMPCYDFVPITELRLIPLFARKRKAIFKYCFARFAGKEGTSPTPSFFDVTGGEYKIRERIQRGVADPRLLAIPTSWSRVADSNLNWGAV